LELCIVSTLPLIADTSESEAANKTTGDFIALELDDAAEMFIYERTGLLEVLKRVL
jgi:hypothetical protein